MDLLTIGNNAGTITTRLCALILGVAAVVFIVYRITAGKFSLVAIGGALLGVVAAGVVWGVAPAAFKAGNNTGKQIGGGGSWNLMSAGYSNRAALNNSLSQIGLTIGSGNKTTIAQTHG